MAYCNSSFNLRTCRRFRASAHKISRDDLMEPINNKGHRQGLRLLEQVEPQRPLAVAAAQDPFPTQEQERLHEVEPRPLALAAAQDSFPTQEGLHHHYHTSPQPPRLLLGEYGGALAPIIESPSSSSSPLSPELSRRSTAVGRLVASPPALPFDAAAGSGEDSRLPQLLQSPGIRRGSAATVTGQERAAISDDDVNNDEDIFGEKRPASRGRNAPDAPEETPRPQRVTTAEQSGEHVDRSEGPVRDDGGGDDDAGGPRRSSSQIRPVNDPSGSNDNGRRGKSLTRMIRAGDALGASIASAFGPNKTHTHHGRSPSEPPRARTGASASEEHSSMIEKCNNSDSRGRCVRHPDVRLRKRRLFGGEWRVLAAACPDCCMDELAKLHVDDNASAGTAATSSPSRSRRSRSSSSRSGVPTGNAQDHRRIRQRHHEGRTAASATRPASMPPPISTTTPETDAPGAATFTSPKRAPSQGSGHRDASSNMMVVRQMEYIDVHGIRGHYSGTVNVDFFPHGIGTMTYDNGTEEVVGVWKRGKCKRSPSSSSSHDDRKEQRRRRRRRRRRRNKDEREECPDDDGGGGDGGGPGDASASPRRQLAAAA